MTWEIKPHALRWPILGEQDERIESIQLRPLRHGDHVAAVEKLKDEDDRLLALLQATTGLPETVLTRLKRPDYNTLARTLLEMVTFNSAYFLADQGVVIDPDQPVLLVPVHAGGRLLESLSLEVPTLHATRAMAKLKTATERAEFITAHCTGLMLPELSQLSTPDWNQLQERLDSFLNEPAASFPIAM